MLYMYSYNANKEIQSVRTKFMEEKKKEIKNYVNVAYDTITKTRKFRYDRVNDRIQENVRLASALMHNLYNKYHGKIPENELKEMLSDSLRGLNFLNGRGYYFISEMSGKSIMHGRIKKVEKTEIYVSRVKGAKAVQNAIMQTLSNGNEGFARYSWYKSKDTNAKLSKKISYVMKFEPYDWYFGAGDYVDNIELELQKDLFTMLGENIREDGGYIYIGNDEGFLLLSQGKNIARKNIIDLKDKNGFKYIENLIKMAKQNSDGVYVKYFSPVNGEEVMSFVRYEEKWKWIIGTFTSLENLEKDIVIKQHVLKMKLFYSVMFFVFIFLLLTFLVYWIARNFKVNVDKSFDIFENYYKQAADRNVRLDVSSMEYQEFEILAVHTNTLVDKIKDLNTKLEKKLQDTEMKMMENEKMAVLGELVAGFSHEINTPVGLSLTGITHFAHINENLKKLYVNDNLSKEEFEEFIKTSRELSDTITINLDLAADIIRSFKKVAIDQTSREKREFKLGEYLDEILLSLKNKTKKMNIKFTIKCDDDLLINSYPGALSQILTNLVINSILHGFDKKRQNNIHIIVKSKSGSLHVEYSDDGKGIAQESLDSIFDPFYSTRKQQGSSGLGMNIIRKIVTEELNGTIVCKNNEGNGVTFNIVFPL